MNARHIEMLQQMPIFGGVSDETLEYLLQPARVITVPGGSFFFREGDAAEAMYVLERGSVSVTKNWQGRELALRELGEGDCVGEMALLDLFPRSASVLARQDCRAIELTPANLYRLYEHDVAQFATIQMNIAREMSRRLRATDDLLFRAKMGDHAAVHEQRYAAA